MQLHNKDRELQIRLAELQADIQISLTTCFGFFTALVSFVIGLQQVYFSLPSEDIFAKSITAFLTFVGAIILYIGVMCFIKKALNAREQMNELRKQDMW